MLSIKKWTREARFEYNLQDVTVIACIDDMWRVILSQMEMLEKEHPRKWTELGI
jgi:hypothetical protein